MMQISNSTERWGFVSMAFHWIVALLVIFMWGLGYAMTHLIEDLQTKFEYFQLHKSIGLTVLLLAFLRLVWRLTHRGPALPSDLKPYERGLAHLTHYGLYAILFLMPLLGLISADTSELTIPTRIFDLFALPTIFGPTEWLHDLAKGGHELLGWALLGLLVLHVGAALKHHFILKDETLRRMLPFAGSSRHGDNQ
ncbi:cytochrome b [Iodidimonas nitroreducens]|uniref:Cytochrome b n=1 Tax=Iodidimonas nitroreducens TaxID=1236968 RepID=A0A5A7N5R4_9PROT|nr:cytochrome b [Iodidimonas nitroreducens]GER03663.1 cytochrome b [Iodidimonas nitroreducens]